MMLLNNMIKLRLKIKIRFKKNMKNLSIIQFDNFLNKMKFNHKI